MCSQSAVRNSFPWASNQRTRATSWAAFLTWPWEICRSWIIERYFPRALLSGLAASKWAAFRSLPPQRVDLLVGVEELRDNSQIQGHLEVGRAGLTPHLAEVVERDGEIQDPRIEARCRNPAW